MDQHVVVWDHLLISGLVVATNPAVWGVLTSTLGEVATVVSAVATEGHWYPLVWRIDAVGIKMIKLFTCEVSEKHAPCMQWLAQVIGSQRAGSPGAWTILDLQRPSWICGLAALWCHGCGFCASLAC